MTLTFSLVFCCVFLLIPANGKNHLDLTNLIQNLTSNYKKHARPTFNLDNPTIVEVGFNLVHIREFEEKNSMFVISGSFVIIWHDFQLTWNPDEHAGITTFLIPQNEVWKPEFVLLNSYTTTSPLGYDRMTIRASYHGYMLWAPYDVYSSVCEANVKYYPFDTHTCVIVFQPWLYNPGEELKMVNLTSYIGLDYYYENSIWELKHAESIIASNGQQTFNVIITFKRRPLFHVLNILVPISLMGLLDVLVFVLPAESGERVGFSVTVLLAMAVYLTVVADNLPSSSEPSIPVICYILVADLLIGSLVTVCTIFGLRLHYKAENETVPLWVQHLHCVQSWLKRHKDIHEEKASEDKDVITNEKLESRRIPTVTPPKQERNNLVVYNGWMKENCKQIKATGKQDKVTSDNYRENNETPTCSQILKWKNIAIFSDSAFFISFLLILVIKNIVTIVVLT